MGNSCRCEANRLAKLNQQLRGVRLGNFRYVDKQLNLGELSGNHFEIVLRDVVGSQPEMEKALISLKEKGFINYFGMQRFGNTSVPTHHIGRAVLKNQWEEAINLILLPRPGDDSEWRRHWKETKNAKSTLEKMPFNKRLSLEQQVLKSLTLTGNNFCQAFASIPRNARMLYLHSYQSMVWNTVASKRIPKWGVFRKHRRPGHQKEYKQVAFTPVFLCDHPVLQKYNTSWICPEKVEDETLHKYSFDDIVLPLPGHSVHYPDNEETIFLPGAYRKLVVKPSDVSWSFMKYDDVTKKLIQSDMDRMDGIPEPVPEEDGCKLALKLSFSLPTSAYATMALRELLRTETSASHHAAMTLQSRYNEQAVADA
ncbi:putative pseudouridylate synthase 7-like [Apostichopus japonicus]|uniref:Putative pseudouridylate synthase 7-like n=1 Tax=Stichopus japonicus TaxID=307972 RepID=A0A2G8KZT0_STIJA|nr:putative pseudouridylate synthase 7-like [Apostichopus japonicus]